MNTYSEYVTMEELHKKIFSIRNNKGTIIAIVPDTFHLGSVTRVIVFYESQL